MKQVAPTLSFVIYPEEYRREWVFTNTTSFGCSGLFQFGTYESYPYYKQQPHIISLNELAITRDDNYTSKNNFKYGFELNLSLSKWYCSRLKDISMVKVRMETGFGDGGNGFNLRYYGIDMQYTVNYKDNISETVFRDGEGKPFKEYKIFKLYDYASLSVNQIGDKNVLSKMYQYFACLAFLHAPTLVNVQLYKWE